MKIKPNYILVLNRIDDDSKLTGAYKESSERMYDTLVNQVKCGVLFPSEAIVSYRMYIAHLRMLQNAIVH